MNNTLEEKLTIYIPTYNRSEHLRRTLEQLYKSPVRGCCITILNNNSTDNTIDCVNQLKQNFPNLQIITHPFNLGSGSANYLQFVVHCKTEYVWILADDDSYDFSCFDDVEKEIVNGEVDLIHVGAHNDGKWDWGVRNTPKNLEKKGYNYFKYASFLPCSIFKLSYITGYIKEAYDYIHFRYSHFPCLVAAYENDTVVYVCKKRVVTANIGGQYYSMYVPFRGFVVVSSFLTDKHSKRAVVKSFFDSNRPFWINSLYFICRFRKRFDIALPKKILWDIMSPFEKIACLLCYFPMRIKTRNKPG